MPAGGGNAERVTFTGSYNISPAISPDGRMLAYITRQGSAFKVMVQELAGGTPSAITDTSDDESPSFAPNGRLLVYATPRAGARRADDHHARRQDQEPPAHHRRRHARARLGPVRSLTPFHVLEKRR